MPDDKMLARVLRGNSDANIPCAGICNLLESLGFTPRVRGDHHIYTRPDIVEILNLQPSGSKAKAYQVKQVRNVILKYKLGGIEDEQQPNSAL